MTFQATFSATHCCCISADQTPYFFFVWGGSVSVDFFYDNARIKGIKGGIPCEREKTRWMVPLLGMTSKEINEKTGLMHML